MEREGQIYILRGYFDRMLQEMVSFARNSLHRAQVGRTYILGLLFVVIQQLLYVEPYLDNLIVLIMTVW